MYMGRNAKMCTREVMQNCTMEVMEQFTDLSTSRILLDGIYSVIQDSCGSLYATNFKKVEWIYCFGLILPSVGQSITYTVQSLFNAMFGVHSNWTLL